MRHLALTAISSLVLVACSGGNSTTSNPSPTGPGAEEYNLTAGSIAPRVPTVQDISGTEFCSDGGVHRLDSYLLENNTWNKGDVTGYTSCMRIKAGNKTGVSPSWRWNWPAGSQPVIRSYPEVIYGQKPWYSSSTSALLPQQVDKLSMVTASFSAQLEHDSIGGGNLAFDIWMTSSKTVPAGKSNLPLHTELMILLDYWGSYGTSGDKIGETRIDGIDWEIYNISATWGPGPWQYITYKPKTIPASPYAINIRLFLDDLQARQLITGQEWLTSVELGTEIIAGNGQAQLTDFTVEVK